jgi:hypothetical protein
MTLDVVFFADLRKKRKAEKRRKRMFATAVNKNSNGLH